jgi:DNA-binding IclR family transcriptional regulator
MSRRLRSSHLLGAVPRNVKTQSVPALERGLEILEYLSNAQHGVTHSQVTRRLQLPRSSCHALLLTFTRCGYVERDKKTGRYRLGLRLYGLANTALAGITLRDQAASILRTLMQKTGLTVHLAVLEDGEAVLVDKVESPGTPRLATWIGKRMGLHCTALGKALIAHLPEDKLDELVRKQGLLRHNDNTIASVKKLRQACEVVRQVGYAIDDEEEEVGVRCIGAPVFDGGRQIVAAISVAGTSTQIENISALATQVREAARHLSHDVNWVTEPEFVVPDRTQPSHVIPSFAPGI